MKQAIYISLLCGALFSCRDDGDTNNFGLPASIAKFSVTEASSIEGSGLQQVRVYLDHPQEGNTLIDFSVSGNTVLANNNQPGDIKIITESPLLIPPGETEAFIDFELLDDANFESDLEVMSITLERILEGNAQLSTLAQERNYQHHIVENEYELNLRLDPNTSANVDLIVELPNNRVLVGNHINGSEKVVIDNIDQNTSYLVTVWYFQGSDPVNYELSYQQAGSEIQVLQTGHFKANESNEDFSLINGNGTHQYKLIRTSAELDLISR